MRPLSFVLTIGLLLIGLTVSASAWAGEDDYVRWSLVAPAASPYYMIRYEITKRRPATTVVHRRNLPGLDEGLHALGLLTPEESDAIFAALRQADALTLPDARAARRSPGALLWDCDVHLDGKDHHFSVTDPTTQKDRRYAALFALVRDAAIAHAGELPFRNVFFPAGQRGWVNIESVPASKVMVDGLDTQLQTPLYAYEVAAGNHEVRLVSSDGRFDRTYTVRIEAQGTTTLRVDLR
ncbi:MAG: hypothetical protein U1F43_38215 [Myxococcota bacterium]